MAVRRGSATPSKIYRGTIPVKKVMRGTVEVWSASIYPVSGTWAGNTTTAATPLATHTIAEDGVYNLTWAVTWEGSGARLGAASIERGASLTPIANGSFLNSAPGSSTATAAEVSLSAGELISFRAATLAGIFPATGEWTITKV